jgi:hypothetical protein
MSLRGRLAAAPPPLVEAQFLVVRAAGGNFALPSDVVRGILPLEEAADAETVTFQGQALPLRNLAGRFGWSPRPPASGTKIILCGAQDSFRAFIVDEVCGLSEVPASAVRPLPPHFAGPERGWFSGLFLFRDAVALVVHPDWLLGLVTAAPALVQTVPPPAQALVVLAQATPSVSAVTVPPGRPASEQRIAKAGESPDIVELEEASDAEDTPWAEL